MAVLAECAGPSPRGLRELGMREFHVSEGQANPSAGVVVAVRQTGGASL